MQKGKPKKNIHTEKKQPKPGLEKNMAEAPEFDSEVTEPGKKLTGKVALITGGDSGIGRSIAVTFAKHGADVAICYLNKEKKDAQKTKKYVEAYGSRCLLLPQNLTSEKRCKKVVEKTHLAFKRLDILVNNAGTHYPQNKIENISSKQLMETFSTNVFSMFYLVKAALTYLKSGSVIINTASVTAYRGSAHLIDYSATKGAIVSFTRSLAASLTDRKIRVNAVAPGPVWTPLIVSSMKPKEISTFGSDSPMGRAGQPVDIAPCYLFLASDESSYLTGQVLHPNGGEIVNG
jgi:NAD(P)-dependent dehydrogenase (short-subunit alcohol dehydrogenase family)